MKIEEAITYAIMSDGHGKTTDQIADAINRHGWHQHKDGKPLPPQHRSIISLSSPLKHL